MLAYLAWAISLRNNQLQKVGSRLEGWIVDGKHLVQHESVFHLKDICKLRAGFNFFVLWMLGWGGFKLRKHGGLGISIHGGWWHAEWDDTG